MNKLLILIVVITTAISCNQQTPTVYENCECVRKKLIESFDRFDEEAEYDCYDKDGRVNVTNFDERVLTKYQKATTNITDSRICKGQGYDFSGNVITIDYSLWLYESDIKRFNKALYGQK